MWTEFRTFLVKDNVIGLAIAVILGLALNQLVGSIVDDVIMPVVGLVLPQDQSWQQWAIPLRGESQIKIGNLLANLLNFLVVGFVAWRISKLFVREKEK